MIERDIEREIDREEEKDREGERERESNGNLKNVCIFGERQWSE